MTAVDVNEQGLADTVALVHSSYVNGHALVVDGGLASTHPFVPGQLF